MKDYRALLEQCDVDDISDMANNELFDYLSMALQELGTDEAAFLVLSYRLGNKFTKGQYENIAHDMQEERLWEEYSDMSFHEELYNITSLLYKAFNGKFPNPDAADLAMKVSAQSADGEALLKVIDESLIARFIGLGQDDHAIINRLFNEKILGSHFKEAKDIIWSYEILNATPQSVTLRIITGRYWVLGLQHNTKFEVKTHKDYAQKNN